MRFNDHSRLSGRHAVLSASKYHWINYEPEKMVRAYAAAMAAHRGTELHAFAHEAIKLGIKLPKAPKTLNLYVNDGIGYRMTSEQILRYSDNFFGTADTISFRNETLRVHDLKTGIAPASFKQLLVYCALFCLEYSFTPFEIRMEMRIYQNNEVYFQEADPDAVMHIMEKMKMFDRIIEEMKAGDGA